MRKFLAVLLIVIGLVVGVLGSGQVFFAAAAFVFNPTVLGLFAVLFVVLITGLSSWVGFRVACAGRPLAKGFTLALICGVVYTLAIYFILLRPPVNDYSYPKPGPDVQYWQLPTGSRIAYVKSPGVGEHKSIPVIMLHGGPGFPMLPYFQALPERMSDTLTAHGYDVYYYDQLGCGFSSRLDLRTEANYTVARHTDDLDAIRVAIGADQMILIGFSWGATLASQYMLKNPQHVAKVVFVSPGPLTTGKNNYVEDLVPEKPLSPEDSTHWLQVIQPTFRILVGRQLANLGSRAVFYLIPDWEVDRWAETWSGEMIRLNRMRGFCNDTLGGSLIAMQKNSGGSGDGFFCLTNTVENLSTLPDPRPKLKENQTPALILRGQCDYIGWSVALDFRKTFPNSRLLPIPGAGHLMWVEQPQIYSSAIAAFIADAPLPIADYTGEKAPE